MTGRDSTQEIKVLLLFKQLELNEDAIFPKYNGIGVGEREVPRGENIAAPNQTGNNLLLFNMLLRDLRLYTLKNYLRFWIVLKNLKNWFQRSSFCQSFDSLLICSINI